MMLASAIFLASIGLFVIIPTMQLSTLAISATVREGGRGTAQSDTTVVASAVVAARPVLDTQSSLIDGLQADFRPTEDMEDRDFSSLHPERRPFRRGHPHQIAALPPSKITKTKRTTTARDPLDTDVLAIVTTHSTGQRRRPTPDGTFMQLTISPTSTASVVFNDQTPFARTMAVSTSTGVATSRCKHPKRRQPLPFAHMLD